jgi:hypothetical protein
MKILHAPHFSHPPFGEDRMRPFAGTLFSLVSFLPAFALGVLAFSAGCVSTNDSSGDVIERSAELRPAWAEGDFSSEGTGEKFLLTRKGDITRLELGIKQAQAAGLDRSCKLVQERMRAELESHALAAGDANTDLGGAVGSALAKMETQGQCPDVSPKFVYWELLRKDTAEGSHQAYDVYVLLALKKRQYVDALGIVLDALKTSGVPGAGALAEKVAESYNDEPASE